MFTGSESTHLTASKGRELRHVQRDPRDQIHSYDWTEREDHQASLAGVPAVVLSGKSTT